MMVPPKRPQTIRLDAFTFGILVTLVGLVSLILLSMQIVPATAREAILLPSSGHTTEHLLPVIASSPDTDQLAAGIDHVMELSFGYQDARAPGDNVAPSDSSVQTAPPLGLFGQSEYMIGSVAVAVIFPESDGSVDNQTENWSMTRMNNCVNEITAGLTWWQNQEPRANLSFYVHSYGARNTGYEPITRSSWTSEGLWIAEVLTGMGYTGATYFDQVTALNNYEMGQYGTDWAYTIFVVDDLNDADNRFLDNQCAYAYVGGPFFVMTYDNYLWGNASMDLVTAHETGHIFWATDEYNGQTEYSGYLNVADNESATCVMDSNVQVVCAATRGQLGWRDSDSDNVLDPVDTLPDTSFAPSSLAFTNIVTPPFTGLAVEVPLANTNSQLHATGNDVSINVVTSVQYRVDGGSWDNATAMDGSFGSQTETFTFATPVLSAGTHIIEVRAQNTVGNWEHSFAVHSVVVDLTPPAASINAIPGFVSNLTAVSGSASDNVPGALQEVQVQIKDVVAGNFWNGSGWSSSETWQVASGTDNWDCALPSLQDGASYEVKARAHDKAGNVSSVASQSFVFDASGPTVTIEDVPAFVSSLTSISGSAADSSPGVVDKVQIQLANSEEETYWNGSDWTSSAIWLDAQGVEIWAYSLPATEDGSSYTFQARSTDKAGNESTLVSRNFTVDTSDPGISLGTLPSYLNHLDSVNGSAWDAAPGELEQVQLQIVNLTEDTYWDGASWSDDPSCWLQLGVVESWSCPVPLLSNGVEYKISVCARDGAGNESSATTSFCFDNAVPSVTMEAIPDQVSELLQISGTADDISGTVERVVVLIHDPTSDTYWAGESWVSQESWIKANGTAEWSCGMPQFVRGSTYEVQAKAVDRAGNESSTEHQTFGVKASDSAWLWIIAGVAVFVVLAALVVVLRRRSLKGYTEE